MTPSYRAWLPDAAIGALVALVALLEAWSVETYPGESRVPLLLVGLGVALAAGLSRRAPGAALILVWTIFAAQVLLGVGNLVAQLAVGVVAFGTARWGRPATLWLSGLSIPLAGLVGLSLLRSGFLIDNAYRFGAGSSNRFLIDLADTFGDTWEVGFAAVAALVLMVPWLAGLALRFRDRAQSSRVSQVAAEEEAARAGVEREQAREIARLREEQTRMARDVHDVVGHSLAVILAQAESAQYLPDDDPQALKETMATIATSARSSLQDVRQVLTATHQPARTSGLDSLVAGVRASGHEVVSTEVGTPQPLPPELETVAYRVLQEMLTNAIKHGRRDAAVLVERHWEGELRIEVRNVVDDEPAGDETRPVAVSSGLEGMRRRLESVGGRLDVRRREEAGGATFTATAWLPVRTAAR